MRRVLALALLLGCGRIDFAPTSDGSARDGPVDTRLLADALGPCTRIAISDNFNDGVAGAIWSPFTTPPMTVSEASGQLQVTLATANNSHYGGYDSAALFDLRNHCMFVSYALVPSTQPMVEMTFSARTAANVSAGFVYTAGDLEAFYNPGTFTSYGFAPYDAAKHKVLLLREDAGTMTWETSGDGITFTIFTQQPTPFDLSAINVALESGTFGSVTNPGISVYDDFNAP